MKVAKNVLILKQALKSYIFLPLGESAGAMLIFLHMFPLPDLVQRSKKGVARLPPPEFPRIT